MALAAVTVAWGRGTSAVGARAALRRWRRSAPGDPADVQVVAYFGSGDQYLYQIRDWVGPLEALAGRVGVAVVVRDPRVALGMREMTRLPVLLARWLADLDALMARYRPAVVLYVNQNVSNFDVLAYAGPYHVFLSHGESDKVYMVSNQAKAYDVTFVAGQAAVDRYRRALHSFDTDTKLKVIGRPQLTTDEPPPADLPPTSLPRTVVYAPTTEGSGVPMEYGSLASHGQPLVGALLDSGEHRVVFRPHPQAGRRRPEHAQAARRIADMVRGAAGGHYVDASPRFGWHRQVCDALVCDISALAVDWLQTGKPMVVTRPAQPAAPVLTGGMLSEIPLLPADRATSVVRALHEAAAPEQLDRIRRWARYYVAAGDTGTFVDAVLGLVGSDTAQQPREAR
jgi:hypothetical protein